MTGVKVFGAVLVLFSAVVWGVARIKEGRAQRARAEAFLLLLRHIRTQIDCFSMPVCEILKNADPTLLAACGATAPPADFGTLLGVGQEELSPEARAVLVAFARELGTTYRTEQLRLCDRHIGELEAVCAAARGEALRREKLFVLLPPALAGIVILLLF